MRRNAVLITWFLALLVMPLFALSVKGEPELIDYDHPTYPLVGGALPSGLEINDEGDKVFVSYHTQGFSMLDLELETITHFNTASVPPLSNDYVMDILYIPIYQSLYIVNYDPMNPGLVLDIYDRSMEDIRSVPLLVGSTPLVNRIEYAENSDKIYIATEDQIIIFDATGEAVLSTLDATAGDIVGEPVDIEYEPVNGLLYIAQTTGSTDVIQVLDTMTDQIMAPNEILLTGTADSLDTTLGITMTEITSIAVLESRREIYIGFDEIMDGSGSTPLHLLVYDIDDPALSTPVNISYFQTVDMGYGNLLDFNYEGRGLMDMVPIDGDDRVVFSSLDFGAGMIDTPSRTSEIPLMELRDIGNDPYYLPFFQYGGQEAEYSMVTDTVWVATYALIGFFDPDDMVVPWMGGDDDDVDKPRAEKVEDIIYIYYAPEEGEEFSEKMYEEGDVIGRNDEVMISAYNPMGSGSGVDIDHMVMQVIDPTTGRVVKEVRGDYFTVQMDLRGDELSSSRYVLRVEGRNADGDALFYSDRYIFVDNPNSVPIAGAVLGLGVGVAASIGAGIAVSTITTTASLSVGQASSTASSSTSSWKNFLFGFATEYSEEQLKDKTGKKVKEGKRSERGFINLREIIAIGVAVVFMMIAFGYVEMMERLVPNHSIGVLGIDIFTLPDFYLPTFLLVIPLVLFSIVIIILAVEVAEEASAKMLGLWSEFRLWPAGLITLIISSVFLMPFGYPGKATAKGDVMVTRKMEGFIGTFVLMTMMGLFVPFSLIYLIAYAVQGNIITDVLLGFGGLGLSVLSMMFLAGSMPFRPMDGNKVWKMNRPLSIFIVFLAAVLFWFWNFSFIIVPPIFSDWFVPVPTWIGGLMMLFFGISGLVVLFILTVFGMMKGKELSREKEPDVKEKKSPARKKREYFQEDEE
ncbi:MAG: hypothetical protein ACMUIE_06395 [Thermoplasmatota archaeon]